MYTAFLLISINIIFMRQIALDTETTGLSFAQGHRIVEIGCVELRNYLPTGKTYQAYIHPERLMDLGAIQVSGITDEFLKGKPLFKDVVHQFMDFIEDSPLVIHNATFDMTFLNGELRLLNHPPLDSMRAIDTVKIARKKFPGSPANLDALCRRFQIDLSDRTKHGALLDAQLLADVYLHLMGGRQCGLGFATEKTEHTHRINLQLLPVRTPRSFMLTDEEIQAHAQCVESLNEPVWKKMG